VVVPGIGYHVTHRGNHRGNVYFTDEDRDIYISYLSRYCARYELNVWAWCLMTNHVHLMK